MRFSLFDHRQNVFHLQAMLRANHLLEGGILINPDGIFDPATEQAVLLFQRQNALPQTGSVNYETWKLLSQTARELRNEV